MVTGAYRQTNLADEFSTKVNLLHSWLGQERVTLLFFLLAEGMADGSLWKEIPLKSISDEVVFCHPIIQEGAPF